MNFQGGLSPCHSSWLLRQTEGRLSEGAQGWAPPRVFPLPALAAPAPTDAKGRPGLSPSARLPYHGGEGPLEPVRSPLGHHRLGGAGLQGALFPASVSLHGLAPGSRNTGLPQQSFWGFLAPQLLGTHPGSLCSACLPPPSVPPPCRLSLLCRL